jgi:transcriptional regulator with XRE-family HTH domain
MQPLDCPRQLGEKLKRLREHRHLSPDDMAALVGAESGSDILEYENDQGDMPVSFIFRYAKVFGIPWENIVDDRRDLWLGHRRN